MKKIFYLLLISGVAYMSSCRKDKIENNNPPTEGSEFDKIRDSVFLYAKEAYYWNDALPAYADFKPRDFSDRNPLTALQNEVNALSQYKINPVTGKPYEYDPEYPGEAKYSFIDDGQVSGELSGNSGDFGLGIRYQSANDLRVKFVYASSAADQGKLKRGDQIMSINGRTALDGTVDANIEFINNALTANSIALSLKRANGTTYTAALKRGYYSFNPILKDTVLTVGSKNVGYIVFNSFTDPENATVYLDRAFERFTSRNISELIVDLRYNGGGYVTTAEHLTNLISPPAKNGTLMYNTYYNSTLTSGKVSILKNQWRKDPRTDSLYNYGQLDYSVNGNVTKFKKEGSLNISRVFFIGTGATASASELTINNLRPVMDVQLVGSTTYGKPVGFFDIHIGKYELYIPEFETKNSKNQGGYYQGMEPGSADYPGYKAADDLTKDFGDPTEGLLGSILSYLKSGSYKIAVSANRSIMSTAPMSPVQQNEFDLKLNHRDFKGMIKEGPGKK